MSTEATRPVAPPATDGHADRAPARTVRDAAFDVLRERGLTTIHSNPGSTEVPLLAGLPEDLRFVLGPPRGVGRRHGDRRAIGSGEPAFVLLHTTAGLGNAVSALATARVNRAPLVVVVGQQDRRHLALRAVPRRAARGPRRRLPRLGGPARPRPGRARRHLARLPRGAHAAAVPRS